MNGFKSIARNFVQYLDQFYKMEPFLAAKCNGVSPSLLLRFTFALLSMSSLTTSSLPE